MLWNRAVCELQKYFYRFYGGYIGQKSPKWAKSRFMKVFWKVWFVDFMGGWVPHGKTGRFIMFCLFLFFVAEGVAPPLWTPQFGLTGTRRVWVSPSCCPLIRIHYFVFLNECSALSFVYLNYPSKRPQRENLPELTSHFYRKLSVFNIKSAGVRMENHCF